MTQIVNRYKQLTVSVPQGTFYASSGQTLPFRSSPYVLKVTTGVPLRQYEIYNNNVYYGSTTTNSDGLASISLLLNLGANEVKLVDSVTQAPTFAYATTKTYATWLAAIAQVIESIDYNIEDTLDSSRLSTVSPALIEAVFGATVGVANDFAMDTDTYREMLQEIRLAYRHYGATEGGIARVVRALLQISPLIYGYPFLSAWTLGADQLYPTNRTSAVTTYTTSPLTNILTTSVPVSVVSLGPGLDANNGSLQIDATSAPATLKWTSPGSGAYGPTETIAVPGTYYLKGTKYVNPMVSHYETFNIQASNNTLTMSMSNKAPIDITLTTGAARTAAQIAADINSALAANVNYGGAYVAVATASSLDGGPSRVSINDPTKDGIKVYYRKTDLSFGSSASVVFDHPYSRLYFSASIVAGVTTATYAASTISNTDAWPDTIGADEQLWCTLDSGSVAYSVGGVTVGATPASNKRERVKVTSINKSTRVLTFESPVQFTHDIGVILFKEEDEIVSCPGGNAAGITVNVGPFTTVSGGVKTDTVTLHNKQFPSTWSYTNMAGATVSTNYTNASFYDVTQDPVVWFEPNRKIRIPVPHDVLQYAGYTARIAVWSFAYGDVVSGDNFKIDLDFGSSTATGVADSGVTNRNAAAGYRPRIRIWDVVVPSDATKFDFILNGGLLTTNQYVQKVRVSMLNPASGPYLGDNTPTYGDSEAKLGRAIYVWSSNPATTSDLKYLGDGVTTQDTRGNIDVISADMAWLDKFQVTEYTGVTPKNVVGYFDETAWALGASVNMSMVLRTPTRFTYMQPTTPTKISQTITFTTTPAYTAPLTIASNSSMVNAVLLENGVPVTQNNWLFDNDSQVHILYAPTAGSYVLQYEARIQYTSAVIDLGASWADYLWMSDYHMFSVPKFSVYGSSGNIGVSFNTLGIATLLEQSDMNKATSFVTEDLGLSKRIVPASQWKYLDQSRIQIDTGVINTAALYTITYVSNRVITSDKVGIVAEIRSATSSVGVASASYMPFTQNHVVGSVNRYHQIRVNLSNVEQLTDCRLASLVLKGLNVYGVGGTIPMIRP